MIVYDDEVRNNENGVACKNNSGDVCVLKYAIRAALLKSLFKLNIELPCPILSSSSLSIVFQKLLIMWTSATKDIFIVGAKRTPFGKFGGKLKNISATDLAVVA